MVAIIQVVKESPKEEEDIILVWQTRGVKTMIELVKFSGPGSHDE